MAAAIERMAEYQTHNSQFTKRIYDYLYIMFKFQVSLPRLSSRRRKQLDRRTPLLRSVRTPPLRQGQGRQIRRQPYHQEPRLDGEESRQVRWPHTLHQGARRGSLSKALRCEFASRLSLRLVLTSLLRRLQGYFGIASELHRTEMKAVLMAYIAKVKKSDQEESAESESRRVLSHSSSPSPTPSAHPLLLNFRLRHRWLVKPGSQVFGSSRPIQDYGGRCSSNPDGSRS